MTIRVALNHRTSYDYDKLISVNPQMVRLRPAPHCRTPILSYSLKVEPTENFCNWQQDPHGNFIARFVFPKKTRRLSVTVDLVADMSVINPFDFFIEDWAENFPFKYDAGLERELRPFLETEEFGPKFKKFIAGLDRKKTHIVNFLVELNRRCQEEVKYLIRLEPGVQTPEETLVKGSGSCRDSAWLLVQVVRQLGLAARFVSGYLIQLAPDQKSLDGPSGTEIDFTDLHAWTEIYVPGAGWIGLDPTSGLLAGEGHIPLAATPDPSSAAPITGSHEKCEVEFDFAMSVTRIHEDPRVTKPYTSVEWEAIEKLGHKVDKRLTKNDVRLTIGGEPTFVSIDDMDGAEWNTAAVGPDKRRLSEILIKRLRARFCPGALLHYGQGKWYPGESLPRWALACFWRKDGVPAWEDPDLIADVNSDNGHTVRDAHAFANRLADILDIRKRWIVPAYEDVAQFLIKEQQLPVNVDPRDPKLNDPEERARMARVFQRGVGAPVGFVVPLRRQWWQAQPRWTSGPWPVRSEKLFLLPGDSPIGLRLPIDSLPWAAPEDLEPPYEVDPLSPTDPLPRPDYRQESVSKKTDVRRPRVSEQYLQGRDEEVDELEFEDDETKPSAIVRTALCIEPRNGTIHIFMPPMERLEDYLDLAHAIEVTAGELDLPVVIEGYLPPHDARVNVLKVTPDPGVIEVNTHPVDSWEELVSSTRALYEEARLARLGTEKFDLDGKHWGTGGGNHVVLGGRTPADSPFLRRPDLLKSMIAYWINHPSLSYLFSGRFIGPTSQAPRVDEGRRDALYELDLAFSVVPKPGVPCPPWLVDRIFRNLLTDLTGNTHRAEFCIDKLYSPDSTTGRLGLLELRGFEMPPHAEMSLTQQLLIRAMIARFWEHPYELPVVEWGTTLHDRFLLPHFVWEDFKQVIADLKLSDFEFESDWFASHFEFRFPRIGDLALDELQMELRTAIEPWYVLGEEPAGGGTVRFVDSSVERLQLKLNGVTSGRYVVTCNSRKVPLVPTGVPGEMVAAVRYRAWQPASCLHPTVPVHSPLTFDILDTWASRSIGGCMVHVAHPAGRNYESFPVNPYEAEARRAARFFRMGHTPGQIKLPANEHNPMFPVTLDLRRKPS